MAVLRSRVAWARSVASVLACLVLSVGAARPAHAHFILDSPPSWMSQTMGVGGGSPQKLGPCGDEGGGTPTGTVTPFQTGQTITVQWTETVGHDGWFRIALSYKNRSDLVDPPVVIDMYGASADAGYENPPVAPVLADHLFPHLASSVPTTKTYTYSVTLPSTPCTKCTLQVIQFMNAHPSNLPNFPDGSINPDGYFYHHCADIALLAGDGGGAGAVDSGSDAAGSSGGSGDSGPLSGASDASTSGSSSGAGASSGSGSSGGATSSGASSGAAGSSGTGGGDAGESVAAGGSGGGCGCHVSRSAPWPPFAVVTGLAVASALRRRRRKG